MSKNFFSLGFGFFLLLAPSIATAKQLAVVVGNDAYAEVPQLVAGVNDARAMRDSLQSVGFDVELVENGTKRQMSRSFSKVESKIEPGDTVVFHFSGHGFEIDGQNWLLPIDVPAAREGEAGLVKDEAFNAADVIERFRTKGAGRVIAILDACRNNPFARSFRSSTLGLAQMDAPSGALLAFATSPGSVASDGKGRNGLYSQHLIESSVERHIAKGMIEEVRQHVAEQDQPAGQAHAAQGDDTAKAGERRCRQGHGTSNKAYAHPCR